MQNDLVEIVARHVEAELCKSAERHPGAIWAHEAGRNQCMVAAQAALTALQSAGVVTQGWQDIASAPRDAVILLGFPIVGNLREDDRRVYEGRWNAEQKTFTSVNGFLLLTAATHWQPLPTPPLQAARGGA
jgi:hypothetical protein